MTRKDYIRLARALNSTYSSASEQSAEVIEAILRCAYSVASELAEDNARFNATHFIDAVRGVKAVTSRPMKRKPVSIDETELHTWFERDRQHVELRAKQNDKTIVEFWDESVSEAIENGFLDPKNFHASVYEYAAERGILPMTEGR